MKKSLTIAVLGLLACFLFLPIGCAHLDPGADPIVVRSEQVETTALATFDLVLGIDDANRPFFREKLPAFHKFCEDLRAPMPWGGTNLQKSLVLVLNLHNVKTAYKAHRDNKNVLEAAIGTTEAILTQATAWMPSITNKPTIFNP